MFAPNVVMPSCYTTMTCPEGSMTCGSRYKRSDTANGTPTELINVEFPVIKLMKDMEDYTQIQEENNGLD